jgi:phosphohistidine phosphatase SixA
MRLLVLARHGESALNVERVVNSDAARHVRLTEGGRAESRLLGAQVRNCGWTSASIPGSGARAKRPKSQ